MVQLQREMNNMSLYDLVKQIENEPSKNAKLALLKENTHDDDLREFFYLALEPTIIFYIKKIPLFEADSKAPTSLGDATYQLVNKVASRKLTGHAALDLVADLFERLDEGERELLRRIVLKDARCGVSEKTVNKVWKGLCTEKLYMRCASFNQKNLERVMYPAIAEEKADGLFINAIRKNGTAQFLSRNMKPMTFHGNLEPEIEEMEAKGDFVIHGEGLVLKEGRKPDDEDCFLDRKTGNGIISKAIKGTISPEEAARVCLKVWDVMPLEAWRSKKCDFPYEMRRAKVHGMVDKLGSPKIKYIDSAYVDNIDEAYEFFGQMLALGREGTIVKNLNGIWKSSTSGSKDAVKMKKKDPADLLCTGTYAHKQEYVMRGDQKIDTTNWIGGLNLESSDGLVKVNSGSGLDDEGRQLPPEHYIGKIIEVEYNEIITAKNKDGYSLFLPIIKEVRDPADKDEADSYELILERAKANKKGKK
jgi:hypothetical protein